MNWTLFKKVLRDVRWPLPLVGLLLMAYQMLWAKITERIGQILDSFLPFMKVDLIKSILFQGPGKITQTLMGGEMINLDSSADMLTIGYVHPVVQTIFCIWAIGRASGALAGEIDRGTMELLLAQPIRRWQVVLTHLAVDLVAIPFLCFSLIFGTWAGVRMVGLEGVDLARYFWALLNAGVLMFAVSGYTMALSALGRFRWRVMSIALGATLVMFLLNLLGQLWDQLGPWRFLSVFYYYQPQAIILTRNPDIDPWKVKVGKGLPWLAENSFLFEANVAVVLLAVGIVGYAVAVWAFSRRDLPAPL